MPGGHHVGRDADHRLRFGRASELVGSSVFHAENRAGSWSDIPERGVAHTPIDQGSTT